MSSNTTFNSKNKFTRPKIKKLPYQKNIIAGIIKSVSFLLILIPFFFSLINALPSAASIAPNYYICYIIVLFFVFLLTIIDIFKWPTNHPNNWSKKNGFSKLGSITYLMFLIIFITLLVGLNGNINYIKNVKWKFSDVNTQTQTLIRKNNCVKQYFSNESGWYNLSISVFVTAFMFLFGFNDEFLLRDLKYGRRTICLKLVKSHFWK